MNMSANRTFFSIIIPTLNEEKYLPLLLADLAKQSYQAFEVIHVDGNSDDRTVFQADLFKSRLKLKTYQVKKRNVAYQRNFGAKKAKANWLIFMDADDRLPPYFLLGLKYKLEFQKNTDIFTTWFDAKKYTTTLRPLIEIINVTIKLYTGLQPISFGSLTGVRKKLALAFPYNEGMSIGEDVQFARIITKNKYKFRCFEDPRYYTSPRRFKKYGSLNTSIVLAKYFIKLLTGAKIKKAKDYPMFGGGNYEQLDQKNLLAKIEKEFLNLSNKQIEEAKLIWQNLKRNIEDL